MTSPARTPCRLSATTFPGLEGVLAGELRELGAEEVAEDRRAVRFRGDLRTMYRAVLECRTALRVHRVLFGFRARDAESLYGGVAEYDWGNWIRPDRTLAVDPVVHSPWFRHSHFAALKTKDAVVDRVRLRHRRRPNVDTANPDYRIRLRIDRDRVELALDASGHSLHQRGYRSARVAAPVNEVLAAGLLCLAGFRGERPFADPFCGSGTLAVEAAWIASNTAPGLLRQGESGCLAWRDADPALWHTLVEEARARIVVPEHPVLASDRSGDAVRAARENALMAGVEDAILFRTEDARRVEAPGKEGLIVTNPPYGERLDPAGLEALYKGFGDSLKARWTGWTAWVLSASPEALGAVGLRTSRRLALRNGPLDCKFHRYEMYAGSRRQKYQAPKNE